jgi:hypothetical protein
MPDDATVQAFLDSINYFLSVREEIVRRISTAKTILLLFQEKARLLPIADEVNEVSIDQRQSGTGPINPEWPSLKGAVSLAFSFIRPFRVFPGWADRRLAL